MGGVGVGVAVDMGMFGACLSVVSFMYFAPRVFVVVGIFCVGCMCFTIRHGLVYMYAPLQLALF